MSNYPFARYWSGPLDADVNTAIYAGVCGSDFPIGKSDAGRWAPVLWSGFTDREYYVLDGRFGARACYVKDRNDNIFHVEAGDMFDVPVPANADGTTVMFYVSPSPLQVCTRIRFGVSNQPIRVAPHFGGLLSLTDITLSASSAIKVNTFVLPSSGGNGSTNGLPAILYTSDGAGKIILEPIYDLMDGVTAPRVQDFTATANFTSIAALTTVPVNVTLNTTDLNAVGKFAPTHLSMRVLTANIKCSLMHYMFTNVVGI